MNQLKPILLVEDSSKDIELILAAFEESHVANQVIVVRDGIEALEYLRRQGGTGGNSYPIVILLDIKMSKLSGIEVLRVIKAEPKLRHLPVVMLTSSRESPDVGECYRLGAHAYVVKPVGAAEFFQAVKEVGRFWAVVNQPPEQIEREEGIGAAVAAGPE